MTATPHQIPADPAGGRGSPLTLHAASGGEGLSAVFSFRYEHFFHRFPTGYPGVDHDRRMVFEPHDSASTHLCALESGASASGPGAKGSPPAGSKPALLARESLPAGSTPALFAPETLLAVSTAVTATLPGIPATWPEWFGFALLGPKRLARTVINTRMVLHPRVRGTDFFARFRLAVLAHCRGAGYLNALHYCDPAMASRYESLGHRLHHRPFEILPGLWRVPMIYELREFDAHPAPLPGIPKGDSPKACGGPQHQARTTTTPIDAATSASSTSSATTPKDAAPCGTPS